MPRMSGADRRRQIIEAATQAVLQRGLAQAATRDVTQAIGVGTGLLHHYFPSWAELRAEVVRLAVRREIDELKGLVAGVPAPEALDRVADWMVEDEDMRHWRLWLNAQDEAHRDDLLAGVMNAALQDWHGLIAELMIRGAGQGDEKAAKANPGKVETGFPPGFAGKQRPRAIEHFEEKRNCSRAEAAAWRLTALMDGLAAAMLVKGSVVTPEMARALLKTQIGLELGHGLRA